VALPIIQGVGGVKQKPKQVFVLRFLSADADNPTYRLWKSQAFLSEKNAMKEFHDMPGYRGSARPRYTYMTADLEVYELKRTVQGKRAKR
jgi:hypothetical protein